MTAPLHAFSAYGIELEYMIVDRHSLDVKPIADRLLQQDGRCVNECAHGKLGWSNELVLHVLELKNRRPDPSLEPLPAAFQHEVRAINQMLEPLGACLMPTGMHPWMNPAVETRLWPHDHADIYQAYDRIFDCRRGHGWANLQSMHVNLPFADDAEFSRLHAAVRLLLPIIPALAASSPIMEGRAAGFLDYRMEAYRTNALCIPSSAARVIPDNVESQAQYLATVLQPMYEEIAPLDAECTLQHEWLNSRGAIPRFERNAIEVRVIDMQECAQADLAIAAAASAVLRDLYDGAHASLAAQQAIGTEQLVAILHACMREGEQAQIADTDYLRLLGCTGKSCTAGELWQRLLVPKLENSLRPWREPLGNLISHGPLARRILHAVGEDFSRAHLQDVYRQLCDCLQNGEMFGVEHVTA